MTYVQISRILAIVVSFTITYGLYDQANKIWKTKSAKDFSASLLVSLIANEIVWLNYGIALQEWPIITISMLNIPAVIRAIIGYRRWGRVTKQANDAD